MPREFRTVGLWGRLSEPSVAEPAQQVLEHLTKRGIEVFAAAQAPGAAELTGVTRVDENEARGARRPCVAIGGDGTLPDARHVAHRDARCWQSTEGAGFSPMSPEHMLETIDAILGGDSFEERRLMLAAEIGPPGSEHPTLLALNDVVLQKGEAGRMLDFVTTVDGTYVNTHRGDGLIVATPTGSTAYALSCGGPIIQPDVDALVMVPICPHTLSDRPLLLKSGSKIEVRLEGADSAAHIVCDGEELGRMSGGEALRIGLADRTVTLLHPRDYNYYELLRSSSTGAGRTATGARRAPSEPC
jgi:NAD+ kinase